MNKKRLTLNFCVVFILGALLIATFSGCSVIQNMMAKFTPNGMSKQESSVAPETVADFFSRIRPFQERAESIFRRARYFQENRKYRLAIQEFQAVVSIDPNHVQAYNCMGICCDLMGDYTQAVTYYKKALAINPDLAQVQNNLGYSYFLQGDLDPAIQAFKKAIELDTHGALYHNNLALAYAEKGLFQPAFVEFAISGGEAKAHHNLAQIYLKKGFNEEARMHLAQAQSANKSISSKGPLNPNVTASTEPNRHEPGGTLSDFASPGSKDMKKTKPGIEVSNGNGVRFMARDVSRYLAKRGLTVQRLTNARTFGFDKSIIYYRDGYLAYAYRVAKELPGWSDLIKEQGIKKTSNIKIRLIVGKDLVLFREFFLNV